jgi:hypothetical protein
MKGSLIPIGSFALAVALGLLSGGLNRPVVARQSTGGTGCECKFDIMSQTGFISWKTQSLTTPPLSSVFIENSVTVCTSSDPASLGWNAEWTATNLTIAYSVVVKGFDPIIDVKVLPLKMGKVNGVCPCKPGTDTKKTGHTHMSGLTKAAQDAVTELVKSKFPPGTKIDPQISSIGLGASFDCTVSGSNGCGAKSGPLTLSIATYATPKNKDSDQNSGTAVYKTSCP